MIIRLVGFSLAWISAFLWTASIYALTLQEFVSQIPKRLGRIEQFQMIRSFALKGGFKVYLFGGSAATVAHYIKEDIEREEGSNDFDPSLFDYSFSSVFRRGQDLDLVVDGNFEQLQDLKIYLEKSIPYISGDKTHWDIRLLRQSYGEKVALLNNQDFLNQHTDSQSTGLIELTCENCLVPVRDLKNWELMESPFILDVFHSQIRYYFSIDHGKTSRAASGLNPPIFSVIRYLTKVGQFELKPLPQDLKIIRDLIKKFDPTEYLDRDYIRNWIRKNGIKLLYYARNLEGQVDLLESLGLRQKLLEFGIRIDGPLQYSTSKQHLQWWMHKVPLRSFPVGLGAGKTARELGINIVAHDTRDLDAVDSITRSKNGRPNVFISRKLCCEFESAAYGDGFYTKSGSSGAWGNGLSIAYDVDPNAKEGSDFLFHGRDFVVILNKQILKRRQVEMTSSLMNQALEYYLRNLGARYVLNRDSISSDYEILYSYSLRRLFESDQQIDQEKWGGISDLILRAIENYPANNSKFNSDFKRILVLVARSPEWLFDLDDRLSRAIPEIFSRWNRHHIDSLLPVSEFLSDRNHFPKTFRALFLMNSSRRAPLEKSYSKFLDRILEGNSISSLSLEDRKLIVLYSAYENLPHKLKKLSVGLSFSDREELYQMSLKRISVYQKFLYIFFIKSQWDGSYSKTRSGDAKNFSFQRILKFKFYEGHSVQSLKTEEIQSFIHSIERIRNILLADQYSMLHPGETLRVLDAGIASIGDFYSMAYIPHRSNSPGRRRFLKDLTRKFPMNAESLDFIRRALKGDLWEVNFEMQKLFVDPEWAFDLSRERERFDAIQAIEAKILSQVKEFEKSGCLKPLREFISKMVR